jgi:hypothetical protein
MTQKYYQELIDNKTTVLLTPDDILTLKLLRDDYRHAKFKEHGMGMDRARSSLQNDHTLETLERILKQVG